jgi:hypothetical protein
MQATALTSLNIVYNELGTLTEVADRTPLYTALARLTALTELNLAGCFLRRPDELAAAVSALSALKILDVTTSGLSDPTHNRAERFPKICFIITS